VQCHGGLWNVIKFGTRPAGLEDSIVLSHLCRWLGYYGSLRPNGPGLAFTRILTNVSVY